MAGAQPQLLESQAEVGSARCHRNLDSSGPGTRASGPLPSLQNPRLRAYFSFYSWIFTFTYFYVSQVLGAAGVPLTVRELQLLVRQRLAAPALPRSAAEAGATNRWFKRWHQVRCIPRWLEGGS